MTYARAILAFAATLCATLGATACSDPFSGLDEGKPAPHKAAPVRAAGQWREIHTVDGQRAPDVNRCVKAEDFIAAYRLAPRPLDDCSTFDADTKGKTFTVTTVCLEGKSTVTRTTRVTGDFQTSFSLETVTKMNPVPTSFGAKARSTYQITAERIGDCTNSG